MEAEDNLSGSKRVRRIVTAVVRKHGVPGVIGAFGACIKQEYACLFRQTNEIARDL